MKKFFKILGAIFLLLVLVVVVGTLLAPPSNRVEITSISPGGTTLNSGGKSLIIDAATKTTMVAIPDGQKLTFGNHTVTAAKGVFMVNGKQLDFGSATALKLIVKDDGTFSTAAP